MGHQIIKQPNGKYALFSSNVDDFVYVNCTIDEIIEIQLEDYRKILIRKIYEIVDKLEKGEKPYYQFTMSFDEAIKWIKEVHGKSFKLEDYE